MAERYEFNKHNTLSGSSSTHRGIHGDGIVVYTRDNKPIWIRKETAIRLAHTTLEAMLRYWDIIIDTSYIRENVKTLAKNIGFHPEEPYREGCPFCSFVANDEDKMRTHLEEEHIIVLTKEEEGDHHIEQT